MFTMNCKGRLLVVDKPIVMGILNLTPDSFYSGSRINDEANLLRHCEKMLHDGATILDIGGQSSRPGSDRLSGDEELMRVIPSLDVVVRNFPEAYFSIDTYHAVVARNAIDAGAHIINDISGGEMDPEMIPVAAALKVPYICMHMKGRPETMHKEPHYDNVTIEVVDYFIQKKEQCRVAGINDVIIDPGFGFGKTITHNFQLLKQLSTLKILERPILAGLSRKSTIYRTLNT
ncbi:MAG: dihydropteroate synthase, partial [Chitinophagaceae bacterium]|nr:dihydropteroate synthase [Chitinophagaceae bacterium]